MDVDMAALRMAKRDLRALMRQKTAGITAESIAEQSKNVSDVVISMPAYRVSSRIGIYLSMQTSEILTRSIIEHALDHGKQVFVPHIRNAPSRREQENPCKVMEMVALSSARDFEECEANRDAWGIPSVGTETVLGRHRILNHEVNAAWEFTADESMAPGIRSQNLDMVIMPGVAFDRNLARLGHGKGFYDRFLQQYHDSMILASRFQTMPLLVGLALTEQMIAPDRNIPVDASDWRLDTLIVGDGAVIQSLER